jgi:hypothetical protein
VVVAFLESLVDYAAQKSLNAFLVLLNLVPIADWKRRYLAP